MSPQAIQLFGKQPPFRVHEIGWPPLGHGKLRRDSHGVWLGEIFLFPFIDPTDIVDVTIDWTSL